MKLFLSTLVVCLIGTFAHAETWMTDSKKAIEIAKADKKPLVVWFAKSDTKFGEDFDKNMQIGKVVLLKVELGTKDADEWKGSNAASIAGNDNCFVILKLDASDMVNKPSNGNSFKPLVGSTTVNWKDLNGWWSTQSGGAPVAQAPQPVQQQAVQGQQPQAQGQQAAAGTYANTLAFAQANIGRRVGNGGCNDLGAGGAHIGTINPRGAVTGVIVPGAIFEMRNFSISSTDGATWTSPLNEHYGVVESYDAATQTVTVLHQNTQGGRAGGQFVTRTAFRLDTLSRGYILVKAGN